LFWLEKYDKIKVKFINTKISLINFEMEREQCMKKY